MAGEEWRKRVNRVVNTVVRRKVRLDVREQDHGAVSAGTLELASLGKTDRVVESETEGFVHILTALAVKQVLLEVVAEREEHTALERMSRSALLQHC